MTQKLNKKQHKIWVTRPKIDAQNQIQILSALHIKSVCYPLLQIAFNKTPLHMDTNSCQAVVFTSANGVRAYVKKGGHRHIPVFVVGDVTCATAQQYDFTTIYTARGDVVSLSDMIKEKLSPKEGYIYHPASTVVARDLGTLLQDCGYTVHREAIYTVHPCMEISTHIQRQIHMGIIRGVILMSPRTADIFAQIVKKYVLQTENLHIFALSKAVADKLQSVINAHIHIAHYPNFVQVLRHIKREYNIHDEYR